MKKAVNESAMNILGIVPARAGSKRLPGKNIRPLGGLPLTAWTFEAARQSGALTRICLSTDDEALRELARHHGVDAPFLRPAELASDNAGSIDVVLHAIAHYASRGESFDAVVLLQPTSPFRTADTIRRAVELFRRNECARDVIGVSRTEQPPEWTFRERGGLLEPLVSWEAFTQRSQDLQPSWRVNGCVYVNAVERLLRLRRFIHDRCAPLPIDNAHEALDIDTQADWDQAEALLETLPRRPAA